MIQPPGSAPSICATALPRGSSPVVDTPAESGFTMPAMRNDTTSSSAAPALVLGISAQALAQGWGRQKARGWLRLWRNRRHVRTRRTQLREESRTSDAEWMRVLTARLDPRVIGSGRPPTALANALVVGLLVCGAALALIVSVQALIEALKLQAKGPDRNL